MKILLPLIICSAISAALGYYFGRISVPGQPEEVAAHSTMTSTSATTDQAQVIDPNPATVPATDPATKPATVPVPEPTTATVPSPTAEPATATGEKTGTDEEQAAFAERATLTTQTLTDKQGRTIQVSILEVMDNQLKIRRSDGLETTIPLSMLSQEDIAFCNYLRRQAAEKEASKPATTDGFDWDAYFNSSMAPTGSSGWA